MSSGTIADIEFIGGPKDGTVIPVQITCETRSGKVIDRNGMPYVIFREGEELPHIYKLDAPALVWRYMGIPPRPYTV